MRESRIVALARLSREANVRLRNVSVAFGIAAILGGGLLARGRLRSVEGGPAEEAGKPALVIPLECAGGDCPLLRGAPQTAGMRSGFVRLKSQESVGWHTTGEHEEALVVLAGAGEAEIEGGKALPFASRAMIYIPPMTRHNVKNTGREPLEYVYVVTPAGRASTPNP